MASERFWCHSCNAEVANAALINDEYECPICHLNFVEMYEEQEQRPPRPVLPPIPMIHYPIVQMFQPMSFGAVGQMRISDMMSVVLSQLSVNFPRPSRGIDISSLETFTVDDTSLSQMVSAECAICQNEFVVGDRINSLPCSHSYHNSCIIPWLEGHDSCPICRARVS